MNVKWLIGCCALVLTGCHDDDEVEPKPMPTELTVTTADDVTLPRFASYERVTVSLGGRTEADSVIAVSCDADWLSLTTTILPADGIVSLATTDNTGQQRRTATLTFAAADGRMATLSISQLSPSDDDANGDPRSDGYLGYGYDIYQSFDHPMSVRKTAAVIDLSALRRFSSQTTYEVIHDCRLSRTDLNVYSARTASEFSTILTASGSNTSERLAGCKQNCDRAEYVTRLNSLMQNNIGYGVMEKAVWSRTIDRGALQNLRDRDKDFFTAAFSRDLLRVKGQTGESRAQAAEWLLEKYGTHIVVQADYGGKIDYTFTMSKLGSVRYDEEVRCQAEFTLGRLPQAEWSHQQGTVLSSSKRAEGAINVTGGSPATRRQLQADISSMSDDDQLEPNHLMEWLSSINYSDHPGSDENLDIIHFDLMPLWDLFTGDLRTELLAAAIRRANLSSCAIDDAALKTDLYWLTVPSVPDDNRQLTSLSRIVYVNDEPVMNVCSEYVPQIRSDKRVRVAYPIWQHNIQLGQGLFLGDGIHRPAYLMFSADGCYVQPIDSLSPSTILKEVAYAGGNLYPDRHGLTFKGIEVEVHDDVFLYNYGGEHFWTPVVKVGSTFWTRRDIAHDMGFTPYPEDDDNQDLIDYRTGTLFTSFQFDLTYTASAINGWNYGYKVNPYFKTDNNQLWYLPQPSQVRNLFTFIGQNPKALFRGQMSGFEAQFNGYYGTIDILDGNAALGGRTRHLKEEELNVIASKATNALGDACLMLLDNHYRLTLLDDQTYAPASTATRWRSNYYPVRLCRGALYEYPNLSTIRQRFPEY